MEQVRAARVAVQPTVNPAHAFAPGPAPDSRQIAGGIGRRRPNPPSRASVKWLVALVGLAAALALPAVARGGDQAYLSWTLDDQQGRPTVTWKITGSTKWYVGVIQIATGRKVNSKGDFVAENLVVYKVLKPDAGEQTWIAPRRLPPGTYYGRLKLRYDGPCSKNCQSVTSIRSFTIAAVALKSLPWRVTAKAGSVKVTWAKPKNGWFVGMVTVDDNRNFSSPEAAAVWPTPLKTGRWISGVLPRDTYYVRIRVRHSTCRTCTWTSSAKTVSVTQSNSAPRLRPARIAITRRNEQTNRYWWKATFKVCDRTPGKLRIQVLEETGPAGGSVQKKRVSMPVVVAPAGCRSYTLTKKAAFPLAPGKFVRVAIRVRDSLGAWSERTRKVTWVTKA